MTTSIYAQIHSTHIFDAALCRPSPSAVTPNRMEQASQCHVETNHIKNIDELYHDSYETINGHITDMI